MLVIYLRYTCSMSIFQFLKQYYPILFVWLSGITAITLYRRSWPLSYKIMAIFLLIYAVVDTVGNIMGAFYKLKNHFLYNILGNVQFIVVAYFFYCQINSSIIKKIILGFIIIFPLVVIINTIWYQGFFNWLSYSFVFGGSFILILSVAYLLQLYNGEETQTIFKDSVFWFSLSWLFYYAATVPYFGMLNTLLKNFPALALNYYLYVIDIADCIHNLLIVMSFLCLKVPANRSLKTG
jgi:hypothetical protein